MSSFDGDNPPILSHKHYAAPSEFTPENLLREARRQKRLPATSVPAVCVLDPDGDIVRTLVATKRAKHDPAWACYHTQLYRLIEAGTEIGIIGCAVGAAFAVLVAEELFVSGCRLLISITSSGQIQPSHEPPYFITIDRALRDEGTSYHYAPPSEFSAGNQSIISLLEGAFTGFPVPVLIGATWTTDAPFRETQQVIDQMRDKGLLAVEMEAAALYAFAQARGKPVICFAHVTNQMARIEGDFEKGEANGAHDALKLIGIVVERLLPSLS